jgi:hypothetical protein
MEYAGETRNKFSMMRRYLSSTFKNSGLAVDLDDSIKRLIDTIQ